MAGKKDKRATPPALPQAQLPQPEDRRPIGRRSKFTRQTIDTLCRFIRAGNYINVAAECAGIGEKTFYLWRRQAEDAKHPNTLQRYFLQSLARADAEAEALRVQQLLAHGQGDFRAALAYLERKHPERWGEKRFQGQLGADGKPVDPAQPQPTIIERVLVVPAEITDIHEWARQAKVIDGKVREKEKALLDGPGRTAELPHRS
jgi:transposase-like protein